MDRALAANLIAKSGKAVEVAGDVDTLLLDKTGTITLGNRRATLFVPMQGTLERELARLAAMASLADTTPEGKSIVELARHEFALELEAPDGSRFVEFTAQTRMSGIDIPGGCRIRKGAPNTIARAVGGAGRNDPRGLPGNGRLDRLEGGDAAGRDERRPDRRPDQAGRHLEARHPRTVRPAAADGPAGGDGHRATTR